MLCAIALLNILMRVGKKSLGLELTLQIVDLSDNLQCSPDLAYIEYRRAVGKKACYQVWFVKDCDEYSKIPF